MASAFLSEDKEKAIQFLQFVIKHSKWELSTQDAMDLNKHLIWYQGCIKKIEDHIFEIAKVHQAPESKKVK